MIFDRWQLFFPQLYFLLLFFSGQVLTSGQSCDGLNIEFQSEIVSNCNNLTMTMIHDQNGKPFLYVANKTAGLSIYDVSQIGKPEHTLNIPKNEFGDIDAMSLYQSGNYLYLALGSFFLNGESPGLAIINVEDPEKASVIDSWKFDQNSEGAGGIFVSGDIAYLAAMGHGLMIFDVSDKSEIQLITQFVPDLNFPEEDPDISKINARGLIVKDNNVYLSFDAGGLRIIDVSAPADPLEIGKYSNMELLGKPRAYNNLIVDGSLVYVTIDYCGLEILDVSDPTNITQTGWWNPWNCPGNNWFTSPGHTNEIFMGENHKTVFMATGKSDLYAVDISDPTNPDSCGIFGGLENDIGTWGISGFGEHIFLSYICTLGIPFPSRWSGIKILNYDLSTSLNDIDTPKMKVFPNPVIDEMQIYFEASFHITSARIIDIQGRLRKNFKPSGSRPVRLNLSDLEPGLYLVVADSHDEVISTRFVKF